MLGAHQVVTAAGTHRSMGLDQGRRCKAAIEGVYRAFLSGPELEMLRPRYFPRRLFHKLARFRARRALEPIIAEHYPEQVERMSGISRGAGVNLDMLYLGLFAELELNRVAWLPGACSALGVAGGRFGEGAAVGKNFDYPDAFQVGFCVRRNLPREGLRSVDVTVAALAGTHSGVNEAGLAVTYNYGYGQDEGPLAPPISLLVQRLLERCRTVAEAEEMARRAPRSGGAILLAADAGGDLAALEVSPTRFGVRRGESLACANHYLEPSMQEVDIPRDAVYGEDSLPPLRGLRVHASSEARQERLQGALEGEGPVSTEALEAALRDHGPAARGSDDTVCRHGPYYATTASVVLLPATRSLRVVFGRPCEGSYHEHGIEPSSAEEPTAPLASPPA